MSATPTTADIVRFVGQKRVDLLEGIANLETIDEPLMSVAVETGDVDVVSFLCKRGVDMDRCGINGSTPLYEACTEGEYRIVQTLVKSGANASTQCDGYQPIEAAATLGRRHVVGLLLSFNECGVIDLSLRREFVGALNKPTSLIRIAAMKGWVDIVTRLVDRHGYTDASLHAAMLAAIQAGSLEVVLALFNCEESEYIREETDTYLQHAIKYGQSAIAEMLLRTRIATSKKRKYGA